MTSSKLFPSWDEMVNSLEDAKEKSQSELEISQYENLADLVTIDLKDLPPPEETEESPQGMGDFIQEAKQECPKDYSEFTGGDNDRQVLAFDIREGLARAKARVGIEHLQPKMKVEDGCDLGIPCGEEITCGWGFCNDTCKGRENGCGCSSCFIGPSDLGINDPAGIGHIEREEYVKNFTVRRFHDCSLLKRAVRPLDCWKNKDQACCNCVGCQRAVGYCKSLTYSNCVNCCKEDIDICSWDNKKAKEIEACNCCPNPPEINRRLYAGCGCPPVLVRRTCKTNCGPGKVCCGGAGGKCRCADSCINPKGFTCHGHGPLCSCSRLDQGETFRSQINRCTGRKSAKVRCGTQICHSEQCHGGNRHVSGYCRNPGCKIGMEIVNGFTEFTPPCVKLEYPKPWRNGSTFGYDPCEVIPKKKCVQFLGRHTVLSENYLDKLYVGS